MRPSAPLLALALLSVLAACAGSRASSAAAPAAASEKAAVAAPAEAAAAQPADAAASATATVSIPVGGMHCGSCVRRVTTALQAVDGVVSAETLLAEQRAVVTYAPARVAPAALVAAIREAGYEPGEPAPQ